MRALDNEILYKCQSGFQPNDSTVNQLTEIYSTIILNMDKGKDNRFVLYDIYVSKAFDRVCIMDYCLNFSNMV